MSSGDNNRPDLDARVDEIFDRALDVAPNERSAYLEEACADDAGLRAQVERLLRFAEDPPSLLAGGVAADLWQPEPTEAEPGLPARIGPYRILEEIGRGGMGVVYLGERADGYFEQKVAVKVMRSGADSPEARQRFEQERQIIASLQHANIARLYDGGVTEDGRPYSAMELVEGEPIDVYCDEHRLSVGERLRLVEVVGEAVHYAHQNLVVHCDLKPSNILVTANGDLKLLDFGIAKLIEVACCTDDDLPIAHSGSRAITPLYASPEQLRGESVTTASDIYQLGLLLFELLTGERARDLSSSGSRGEESSRAPSTAVRQAQKDRAAAVAAARDTDPLTLARSLSKDLDSIVEVAMRPQPEGRYPSAAELVEDLKRYRRHEPLAARPDRFSYRAGLFVRRNRWTVAITVLLIALLSGYSVIVTLQAQRIARERDRAQRIQAFALGLYGAGDPDRALGPAVSAADLVAHGVARAEAELAEEPDVQAEVKTYLGNVYLRLGLYEEAEVLLRDVLTLRLRFHGEAHPKVAAAQNDLGRLLLERDDPEALSLLEAALAQRRRFLEADHLDIARTLANLGFYLRSAGRHREAEERFREALELQRRKDTKGVDMVGTLSGLAWAVRLQDRPEEAEPLLREALDRARRHYGDFHPKVASGWNNLASVLWQLERWEEGDAAIRQAIASKKGLYGDIHPGIANSLGNLAGALRRRGELERATALYREAMAMRQEVFGASHPRVAQSAAQLAEVLHGAGRLEEAETLFEEALAIFREHLSEDHPSFARVWRGLAAVWLDAGELDRARRGLVRARAIYAGMQSPHWPWRVDVMLAEIDRAQGRDADAATRLREAAGKLGGDSEWTERWREAQAMLAPN